MPDVGVDVFLYQFQFYFLRQGLSRSLEIAVLSFLLLGYRHTPLYLDFCGAGNPNSCSCACSAGAFPSLSAQGFLMLVKSNSFICCFLLVHHFQRLLPKPRSEACTPMHISESFAFLAVQLQMTFGVALPEKSIENGLNKAEISNSVDSMELSKESREPWSASSCFPSSRGV